MWLIYALLTACLWGTGQLFLKKGYARISPLWTAVIDLPIYLLIFVPFSLVKGASFDINPEDILLIFIVATLTVAYYYGLAKGQLAVSGTLIAAYPIVTVIASIMFLGEYISPLQILAVGSVILGTVLISLNDKFRLGKNKSLIIWPIATAFILGISDFVAKIALNGVSVDTYNLWLPLISIVSVSIFWSLDRKGRRWHKEKSSSSLWQTLIGVTMISLGFLFFNFALSLQNASLVTPVSSIYAVLTVILSFVFLKEKINVPQRWGILLTLMGIFLIGH